MIGQRRRPWPLGPRASDRIRPRWQLIFVPLLAASLVARWLVDPIRALAGLTLPPVEGYWIDLSVPVDLAIQTVLWISIYALVGISVLAVALAMLRSSNADEPPVQVALPRRPESGP